MTPKATWPLPLPHDLSADDLARLKREIAAAEQESQYGWGHTVPFGSFSKTGILGDEYLTVAAALDERGWLPSSLAGRSAADVGCFTGGLTAILAARGAATVYAVDEIEAHLRQCAIVSEWFSLSCVTLIHSSLYRLGERIPPSSLDLILLSGVLYHLSDMLVGLHALRELLKPGGVLLIESNAVDDDRSYANFGRFFAGMWWQPSGRCIRDMCEFMGLTGVEVEFYAPGRCVARAVRGEGAIAFKRGLNWPFPDLRDGRPRPLDPSIMAPA